MKVGILTFFRPINNGAVLQACATNRIVLAKLGIESELIDYRSPKVEYHRKSFNLTDCLKQRGVVSKLKGLASAVLLFPSRHHRHKLFDDFINDSLKVSSEVYTSYDDLVQRCQNYDAYIVGSDLVWNPIMAEGINPIYFLQFVNGKTKISYAPSIGNNKSSEEELAEIAKKAETLDFVSVREKTSAEQLQKLMKKKVHAVLDPTLLTYADDWKKFFSPKPLINQKYIFAFMLQKSDTLINQVNALAQKNDCIIVSNWRCDLFKAKNVIFVNKSGPSDFLNYTANAECVVTNSFHGCAFAIIFHKDFYCVPHTERGVRMTDLMNSFNIQSRIVSEQVKCEDNAIDYDSLELLREHLVKDSMNYLSNALLGKCYE